MNVEFPRARSSLAPDPREDPVDQPEPARLGGHPGADLRHERRSGPPGGCRSTCPPCSGPVIRAICASSHESSVSFGTKACAVPGRARAGSPARRRDGARPRFRGRRPRRSRAGSSPSRGRSRPSPRGRRPRPGPRPSAPGPADSARTAAISVLEDLAFSRTSALSSAWRISRSFCLSASVT